MGLTLYELNNAFFQQFSSSPPKVVVVQMMLSFVSVQQRNTMNSC